MHFSGRLRISKPASAPHQLAGDDQDSHQKSSNLSFKATSSELPISPGRVPQQHKPSKLARLASASMQTFNLGRQRVSTRPAHSAEWIKTSSSESRTPTSSIERASSKGGRCAGIPTANSISDLNLNFTGLPRVISDSKWPRRESSIPLPPDHHPDQERNTGDSRQQDFPRPRDRVVTDPTSTQPRQGLTRAPTLPCLSTLTTSGPRGGLGFSHYRRRAGVELHLPISSALVSIIRRPLIRPCRPAIHPDGSLHLPFSEPLVSPSLSPVSLTTPTVVRSSRPPTSIPIQPSEPHAHRRMTTHFSFSCTDSDPLSGHTVLLRPSEQAMPYQTLIARSKPRHSLAFGERLPSFIFPLATENVESSRRGEVQTHAYWSGRYSATSDELRSEDFATYGARQPEENFVDEVAWARRVFGRLRKDAAERYQWNEVDDSSDSADSSWLTAFEEVFWERMGVREGSKTSRLFDEERPSDDCSLRGEPSALDELSMLQR